MGERQRLGPLRGHPQAGRVGAEGEGELGDMKEDRGVTILSRLRKLVFNIRHRTPAARLAESLRRVNRLARLMTVTAKGAPKGAWLIVSGFKCPSQGARMAMRIIKHEAVPQTGSFEVRYSDGRPGVFFYWGHSGAQA